MRIFRFTLSISVLTALSITFAQSAPLSVTEKAPEKIRPERISTVRSNCMYLSSTGRCEKTCLNGSLYMQVPDGSFACVKQIAENEKNK